jgi:3-oxoacid CoA-transferase subunit A
MNKTYASAREAVADVADGASLAVGGFGLSGIPHNLIEALLEQGTTNLETVSNNCGVDGGGLGLLLAAGRIRRTTSSYVGENREFARQYLGGELELELCPQGTLAERLRAGGCGIPAFFTPAGVGTLVAEGGLPWRYAADGSVAVASSAMETRTFGDGANAKEYALATGIVTDFALVRAARGDRHGNLSYGGSARNFNPLAAMAGRVTIAEVERLVEPGELDPEHVDTPGVFVQRVVEVGEAGKRIEKLATRVAPTVATYRSEPSKHDVVVSIERREIQEAGQVAPRGRRRAWDARISLPSVTRLEPSP